MIVRLDLASLMVEMVLVCGDILNIFNAASIIGLLSVSMINDLLSETHIGLIVLLAPKLAYLSTY